MEMKRVKELMRTEKECIMRADTCGRDCAHCPLVVQDDQELLEAYDIVQISLIIMERFNDTLEDILFYKMKEEELCATDDAKT